MRYCLLMHYQEASEIGSDRGGHGPGDGGFRAYADDLTAAGVLIDTEVLESVVATTTVTARNGAAEVQDGPFADTKEKLGGIFVIEVDNLDEALEVGAAQSGQRLGFGRNPPGGADIRRRPRVVQPIGIRMSACAKTSKPGPGSPSSPGTPTVGCSPCWRRRAATSPRQRTRWPMPWNARWRGGRSTAYPPTPKAGSSPWRATDYATCGSRPPTG